MESRLDEYSEVLSRLVSETIACTPKEWNKGTLTIECDGFRINYRLKNDEQPTKASISDKLRSLIEELYVRMDRHGETWKLATITFYQEGDQAKFETAFEYAKRPHQT